MTRVPPRPTSSSAWSATRAWSLEPAFTLRDGIWWPADGSAEAVSYPDDGHRAIAEVEDESYWFRHRNRAIARMAVRPSARRGPLGRRRGHRRGRGEPAAVRRRRRRGRTRPRRGARRPRPRASRRSSPGPSNSWPSPNASIAAVGLFDVIEHLEHPAALLQAASRVLRPRRHAAASPSLRTSGSGATPTTKPGTSVATPSSVSTATCWRAGSARPVAVPVPLARACPLAIGRTLRSMLGRDTDRRPRGHRSPSSGRRAGSPRARSPRIFAVEDAIDRWWPLPFGTSILAAYERER